MTVAFLVIRCHSSSVILSETLLLSVLFFASFIYAFSHLVYLTFQVLLINYWSPFRFLFFSALSDSSVVAVTVLLLISLKAFGSSISYLRRLIHGQRQTVVSLTCCVLQEFGSEATENFCLDFLCN